MGREQTLDVTELEAPAPIQMALDALEFLPAGDYLRLLLKRDPIFLYPLLLVQGFEHRTIAHSAENFEVLIWQKGDSEAEQAATRARNG